VQAVDPDEQEKNKPWKAVSTRFREVLNMVFTGPADVSPEERIHFLKLATLGAFFVANNGFSEPSRHKETISLEELQLLLQRAEVKGAIEVLRGFHNKPILRFDLGDEQKVREALLTDLYSPVSLTGAEGGLPESMPGGRYKFFSGEDTSDVFASGEPNVYLTGDYSDVVISVGSTQSYFDMTGFTTIADTNTLNGTGDTYGLFNIDLKSIKYGGPETEVKLLFESDPVFTWHEEAIRGLQRSYTQRKKEGKEPSLKSMVCWHEFTLAEMVNLPHGEEMTKAFKDALALGNTNGRQFRHTDDRFYGPFEILHFRGVKIPILCALDFNATTKDGIFYPLSKIRVNPNSPLQFNPK
jgi:hypothetical protein